MSRMTPTYRAAAFGCLLGAWSAAPLQASEPYVHAVDVPAELTGSLVAPGQIELNWGNLHSLVTAYPEISALDGPRQGRYALSFAVPTQVGALWAEPRDVVSTDGQTFTMVLDGSAQGILEGARIDALAVDPNGALSLSFDVPVSLGGVAYGPADVVLFTGGAFTLLWSGAGRGVPREANLVGLDPSAAGPTLSFDVPVILSGTLFTPGSLIRDDGSAFVLENVDPAWPAGAQLRDFSFATAAGSVTSAGADSLSVIYSVGGNVLTLSWGSSCAPNDADYEVYQGTLSPGVPFEYNHAVRLCTTGGARSVKFTPPPGGSVYFLVVPHNGVFEGSYGVSSAGMEIPPGDGACRPNLALVSCP